jgi:hypothetical protein
MQTGSIKQTFYSLLGDEIRLDGSSEGPLLGISRACSVDLYIHNNAQQLSLFLRKYTRCIYIYYYYIALMMLGCSNEMLAK